MQNLEMKVIISVLERKYPLWVNVIKDIKIISLNLSLITNLIGI